MSVTAFVPQRSSENSLFRPRHKARGAVFEATASEEILSCSRDEPDQPKEVSPSSTMHASVKGSSPLLKLRGKQSVKAM